MKNQLEPSGGRDVIRLPEEQLLELIRASLEASGRFVLTVTGNSMAPTLHHLRDRVELISPERKSLKPGAIILFRRAEGGCILHRILRRENNGFRVSGDAQSWTEWIPAEQVIAVVSRLQRKGKWISCRAPVYCGYQILWRRLLPFRRLMSRLRDLRRGKSAADDPKH